MLYYLFEFLEQKFQFPSGKKTTTSKIIKFIITIILIVLPTTMK